MFCRILPFRAAHWRLGFLFALGVLAGPTVQAQLEVVNGLAHAFSKHQKVEGWIEVVNRSSYSETAILSVAPLRPKNAPPLDTHLVGKLEIAKSWSLDPGQKARIPFSADLTNRQKATGCMVYVEPAVSLEYQWKPLTDSIGLVAVIRYGVALLAAGESPSDSLLSAAALRDSAGGVWVHLSNRSESLWMPRASWTERGGAVQKNEWVILPGEEKKIKWSSLSKRDGKLVLVDNDRRRWQWNL